MSIGDQIVRGLVMGAGIALCAIGLLAVGALGVAVVGLLGLSWPSWGGGP